ncbi:hypothetical protein [Nannocystis pusilla]|uniref:hypothetical protein n=1 Tax=Nannocystis pusilla TaxID=889268 RepID=UPI003BF080FB
MFDEEAEVRLGFGRRVLLVRRMAVHQPSSNGPVEVRRHGKTLSVASHLVHAIPPTLATSLARDLLRSDVIGFGAGFLGDLTMHHGFERRQQALEDLLTSSFLMVELEDDHGRWGGRAVQPRREEAEPEIRMKPLTWVALNVVDDEEPARPLPRLRFQMRLPDGSTRTGALDGQGYVLVEDIDPGRCWVELKDIRRGFTR